MHRTPRAPRRTRLSALTARPWPAAREEDPQADDPNPVDSPTRRDEPTDEPTDDPTESTQPAAADATVAASVYFVGADADRRPAATASSATSRPTTRSRRPRR